jgi:hypothetical protein
MMADIFYKDMPVFDQGISVRGRYSDFELLRSEIERNSNRYHSISIYFFNKIVHFSTVHITDWDFTAI